MMRKIGIPAILALIICAVAILATTTSTPTETYEFNASPETVVIFADLQPRPGPPRENCPHILVPVLHIWGDGLTYINNAMYDPAATNYAGFLTPEQIKDQLSFLERHGFFKSFDLGPVNPAGTWIEMGANFHTISLMSISVKYSGGTDFKPQLLVQLIERLTPFLQPIKAGTPQDQRVLAAESLMKLPCN